jgi:nucleotide-binding universal stress UspA family protein
MYERVLIPLDGSELAESILPFAEKLAGPLDAEILLLRVIEPLSTAGALANGDVVGPDGLFLEQVRAKEYLSNLQERLGERGLRARSVLGLGVPATEIVEHAKAHKADLIAMSTHGRSGFGRLVFGSVAEEVLRTAPVPVLMIRMVARKAASPVEVRTS